MSRPSPGTRQFSTHRQLLAQASARRGRVGLDAIIVPASRPAANLDHAVTLARALNCQLAVLCSLQARSAEVNDLLASRNFARAIVVNVPPGYCLPGGQVRNHEAARPGFPPEPGQSQRGPNAPSAISASCWRASSPGSEFSSSTTTYAI